MNLQFLYLQNGFTIAMWVKFLDKTDGGTLFNFGAPMREENPFGFMLETFVINKNDYYKDPLTGDTRTWGDYVNQSGFSDSFFTTSFCFSIISSVGLRFWIFTLDPISSTISKALSGKRRCGKNLEQ